MLLHHSRVKNANKPFIIACIPAFNEEDTIAKVLIKTMKYVDKVIVCDDGSSDMTAEISEKIGAEVIRHKENMGKGAALKTLFNRARELDADIIITLDSDGQHDPDEIPKMIAPILEGEADIVNGSRFIAEVNMPIYRKIGNKLLNFLVNVGINQKLTDTQSGFRAYSKRALRRIEITENNMGVDSQIIIDASRVGLKVVEVPINVNYRNIKPTHNPIKHLMMVIDYIIRRIIEKNSLLYLGVPGLLSIIAGILAGVRVIDIFLKNRAIATGTALISIMLLIIGFLLLTATIIIETVRSVTGRIKG